MAFCAITDKDLKNVTLFVFTKIKENPEKLKNFKSFSREVLNDFMSMKASMEKAITLVGYLPQMVSEYTTDKDNRRLLRDAGVSMDAITGVEELFDNYDTLAKYLEIKNEIQPITVVSEAQIATEKKLDAHIAATKVEFTPDARRIINGTIYETRVTDIAKVGYQDDYETTDSPALKHGNTVDVLSKAIFDNIDPVYNDFKELIEESAFNALIAQLKQAKANLQNQGYTFRTGVTVYNKKLKLSGEIDLVAIGPKGEAMILDFKTANQRFNEAYLKNDTLKYKSDKIFHEVGILSKWNQYASQGTIYATMLYEQLEIPVETRIGIIGMNIVYDVSVPYAESKITKMGGVSVFEIPTSQMRPELKGLTVQDIYDNYKKLETLSLGTVTEVQPTQKKRQRKNFDNLGPAKPLDRIAAINEIAATDRELEEEVNWLKNTFGQDLLLRLDDTVNSGLFGRWTLDGITLFKHASQGTGYHEGWHRFSQVFLSKQEKEDLYDSVRQDNLKFRTRDGRRLITSGAPLIDVEEFLAEEFAKYALNPKDYRYPTSNTKPKSLFQKILDFLKRFFGIKPRPVQLFQRLYRGKIGRYAPSINNAFWGNLNSLAENARGEEIVSNERFPLYVRTMDYLVGKALRDAGKSFTAFKQSKRLQSQVLTNVFDELRKRYETDDTLTDEQFDEIENILSNAFDFTRAYLRATSYDTLKDFIVEEDIFSLSTEELAAMDEIREAYSDVPDLGEDTETDEGDVSKEELFTPDANDISAFSKADDALQDFFRTVPKIKSVNKDGTFVYEVNELGYPENHKYYDIFYKTKKILAGAFDMNDMLDRLASRNNQRIFPELSLINDFIRSFISSPKEKNHYRNVQNVQFVQSFYHVMTMPEVPNMQLTMNFLPLQRSYVTFKPTMVSYRRASRNLSLKIIKTWEKNFKDRRGKDFISYDDFNERRSEFLKTPLYMTEDGKILLNPLADVQALYPNNPRAAKEFFEMLGVEFNPKVWEDADAVKELRDYKSTIIKNIQIYREAMRWELMADAETILVGKGADVSKIYDLAGYINALEDYEIDAIAKIRFIDNPISFFNERRQYEVSGEVSGKQLVTKQMTDPLRFVFENMAEIEEKFGERVSSGAFRIEDKTKYPYYVPSSLLVTTGLLNDIQNLGEFEQQFYLQNINPNTQPWMKRSYFYKMMFNYSTGERNVDKNGKPVQILVDDTASVKVISEDGITERHPRSLRREEKFFADTLTLFRAGVLEIPRAETSSTMFSIRLSDYNGRVTPIALNDVLGKAIPENFHAIVKDYFAAEIEKRQWYMENEPDSKFARTFNVFEGILSSDLKDKVEARLSENADDILQGELLGQFRSEIETYFLDRTAELKPLFDNPKTGLPKEYKDMLKDTIGAQNIQAFSSVAKTFVLNHFILSMEFYSLYFGDLYYYKNPFKRGKLVTNTGNTYYIDEYRNEMLNRVQNETLHSIYTGTVAGGKDFRTFKTGIIKDVEMRSAYVGTSDADNYMLHDVLKMRIASGALVPHTPEYQKAFEELRTSLEKYNKINIADGQGIIGMDFYRNFSIITNIWSEEKEREYERQKAIFRFQFNTYFKTDADGNKVALEGEELEEARARDKQLKDSPAVAYFNPLKISYTGPQVKEGPMRPVFDKFSVRPIIPEAAIGKRDEGMLLEMVSKDIDYLKFQSGTKVYQDSVFDWFKQVSEGVYDLNDFTTQEVTPNELFSAYLKHQLSTEGLKERNLLGSQFRKIVFGIKYTPHVVNNPTLFKYFSDLEKDFFDSVSAILEVEQKDLFNLLGIEEVGSSYRVGDMKKFLDLLIDESVKRGVAINNIDYIQYDTSTRGAKYPIDYAFNRQQIQDLLAGLIDDRLRRLKINNSSLIQVSSAGFEDKSLRFQNPTKEDIDKYGTTGLHYYHIEYGKDGLPTATSTMGVKVALIGKYKNLLELPAPDSMGASSWYNTKRRTWIENDTGKIGTLERLNQAMKDPGWKAAHMDKFRMVGYRIPTQNNNFIDNMEIMEFLPEAAGAVIIPPIELIVKSGSDFDIDKMYVIKYTLNRDGKIVSFPKQTLAEINETIKNLTYEERDIRSIKKELDKLLANNTATSEDLATQWRKIRYTIADLLVQEQVSETLMGQIFDNMAAGSLTILPEDAEQQIRKEEVLEGEEKNVRSLSKSIVDLFMLDQEMAKLAETYEDLRSQKSRLSVDLNPFYAKTRYRDALSNQMMKTLVKTLSHPYYFEYLITPSSAATLEQYTNELISSQENLTPDQFDGRMEASGDKLYDTSKTPEGYIRYMSSLEAFDNLLSKRKDLGGYAIQRTFADMFNFIKFSVAQSYSIKDTNKTLHIPLIPPADRSKVIQNGRILMHGDSVSGVPIKNYFDELISLTVDLANSPAYPKMDINVYNRKHVQYLLHQKADAQNVLWFVNQPVLKDLYALFEEKKRKIQGYTLKHAITELALRMNILDNPQRYEKSDILKYEVMLRERKEIPDDSLDKGFYVEYEPSIKKANPFLTRPYLDLHNQNVTPTDFFSFEDMDRAIRNKERNTPLQKKVLAYFASLIDEADALMKVQFANNVDTTKYATLTSLLRNKDNRREIRQTGLFDRAQLDKLENESMIAPFDYTKKAEAIYRSLFPKIYNTATINTFREIIDDVFGVRNIQLERISKIVENDYIEFVYKNFGSYEGVNLSEHFKPQLINTDSTPDHYFFSYRLLELKSKYPELLDIPFVAGLYEDVYMPPLQEVEDSFEGLDNKEIRNVFFLRNPDNPTFEKNIFTGNWRNLINFDPEKLGLEQVYTSEQAQEISSFFNDLIYFSLYQAGLTNTGNGFSDLIPYEYWAAFVQSAFDEMEYQLDLNNSLQEELLTQFQIRFKQMNPKINWRTKYFLLNEKDEDGRPLKEPLAFYKNYYRGKQYFATEDDLNVIRYLVLTPEDEIEEAPAPPPPPPQAVDFPIEIGRYVRYGGDIYIITKPTARDRVWQIYNPLKEGASAKLSVHERKLTPLKSKGTIVVWGKKNYLVTPEDTIIDLETNRIVKWSTGDPNRIGIIQRARIQNPPQGPIGPVGNGNCI